jgi:hypothetical protein
MRAVRGVILGAMIGLAACGGGGGSPAPGDDGHTACATVCRARDGLRCPLATSDCAQGCATSLAGRCGAAWDGYYRCAAALGADEFQCSPSGQPVLRPGRCMEAYDAVAQCLREALAPG